MKQHFRDAKLSKAGMALLHTINSIVDDYASQGYKLSLRQLYYQLVSRDIIPNKVSEYQKLSHIVKEGRMAGIVDWDAIEDRLRTLGGRHFWNSPKEILRTALTAYKRDRMDKQEYHIEVWAEKDALSSILKRATAPYGVGLMINRGYSSTTAMFDAYERIKEVWESGKKVVILYLGDHDPSGIDMVRDIYDRLTTFYKGDATVAFNEGFGVSEDWEERFGSTMEGMYVDHLQVKSIGLTFDQIRLYNPPPNPAKVADPRAADYIRKFGPVSWEVDALTPQVLSALVENEIKQLVDMDIYREVCELEDREKTQIRQFINTFEE